MTVNRLTGRETGVSGVQRIIGATILPLQNVSRLFADALAAHGDVIGPRRVPVSP